jgi:phosphoribosylformylglycinamidine cyclo-ligase
VLPPGVQATVDRSAWPVPPIFAWLQKTGTVPVEDMYRTFNMGIGLVVVCAPENEPAIAAALARGAETSARRIGRIENGGSGVRYVG